MDVNERNTLTKVPTALYTDIDHITLEFNRLMARIDELEREVCNWKERAGAAEDELSDYRTRYESVKD
jgi:predicted  nucleic acid-binding Zn-ribbon protein